ncbi:hypothetical protein ACIGO8_03230 [Streptomyces sp. NPDC053493]|uniref:hypothetical protein n=1 Tax=Streptomyces sp. NPDC053493 TaxID=3365705 RepID=UPI0037CF943D
MISEPELVDGTQHPAPVAPLPFPAQEPAREPARDPAPGPGARRPWLWALGGAVAASAVWAGGLQAYEKQGPDLGGYRTDRDPCEAGTLEGLTSALGPKKRTGEPLKAEHPALFEWDCGLTLAAKPAPYDVSIAYALHRATDPGPEFEATMADPQLNGGSFSRIDDLGESAYVGELSGGDLMVRVLDGRAVLTLSVVADTWDDERNEPVDAPELDKAAMETYLVEDMRQLMAALRK